MYRKDGIANLDIITLVAKDADIARVSVCLCMRAGAHVLCVCTYMHSSE